MNSMSSGGPAERSTFVTVLAWMFIVLSGFSTLMSIIQNIVMSIVFPFARMQASIEAARKVDCKRLVVLTGDELGGMPRSEQMANAVATRS